MAEAGSRLSRVDALQAERRLQSTCLVTLTVIALGFTLYFLKAVFVPFVLALFLTYSLLPGIEYLQKRARMPYWLAAVVTSGLGVGLLVLLGLLISASVGQMAGKAPQYNEQIEKWVGYANTELAKLFQRFDLNIGADPEALSNLEELEKSSPALDVAPPAVPPAKPPGASPANGSALGWTDFSRWVGNPEEKLGSFLAGVLGSVMAIISDGFMVLIFALFLLIGRGTTPPNAASPWMRVERSVKEYIVLKVVISAVTGGLQGFALWMLGVEFAFVFGVLGFLLNFIPNIGPVVATVLPLPVLPLSPDMTLTAGALAIIIPGAIHFVSGNVIEPRIMGDSLDLHPVVVLLTLIFFGVIWGIIGMFLATPITAVIKILLEQSELTRPVAHVLAGRLDHLHAPVSAPEAAGEVVMEDEPKLDSSERV